MARRPRQTQSEQVETDENDQAFAAVASASAGVVEASVEDGPARTEEEAIAFAPGARTSSTTARQQHDTRPTVKIIRLNGREVELPIDIAEEIEQRESRFQEDLEAARRQQPQQTYVAPTPQKNEEIDPFNDEKLMTELFTKPGETLKKIVTHATDKVRQELTGQYTQEQNRKTFWEQFYRENKDLVGFEDLVTGVASSHQAELNPLTFEQARKRIAGYAKAQIENIVRSRTPREDDTRGGELQPRRRTTVEGSSTPAEKPARTAVQEEKPGSISSYLRERRRQRNEARTRPPATQ
ncbi:MAG: hypothetical protein C5B59_17245 [Bacteroidetes bacterium]|nr:MAG: hypothetical protein C5B59_17245 [Bacteroidota bacterium]